MLEKRNLICDWHSPIDGFKYKMWPLTTKVQRQKVLFVPQNWCTICKNETADMTKEDQKKDILHTFMSTSGLKSIYLI